MQDSSKYLIHADVTADGVVERSDVVGAVFGQTEGLLGDELDLRQLQDASKIGRIDVSVESRNGQSFGTLTIATNLDRVETATLAAALETITRVGPCRASVEIRSLEDLRSAKRRRIVDRAQELLVEAFDDSMMSSQELIEEVRRRVRVEEITEYEGLPAGPRVHDSDAIVVVEGRSDVLAVLEAGVKNAIAVEGTNVPDTVAALTTERTTTAFLDGDRGGDLILKELGQIGDVDYVAFAPSERSVEDLSRHEILAALRGKVEYDIVADADTPHETVNDDGSDESASQQTATEGMDFDGEEEATVPPNQVTHGQGQPDAARFPIDEPNADQHPSTATPPSNQAAEVDDHAPETPEEGGGTHEERNAGTPTEAGSADAVVQSAQQAANADPSGQNEAATATDAPQSVTEPPDASSSVSGDAADEQANSQEEATGDEPDEDSGPQTLPAHVEATIDSDEARLLDEANDRQSTVDASDVFDALETAEPAPVTIVLDGTVSQRLLDLAAQRGVGRIVATDRGSFVKRPTSVQITDAQELLDGLV